MESCKYFKFLVLNLFLLFFITTYTFAQDNDNKNIEIRNVIIGEEFPITLVSDLNDDGKWELLSYDKELLEIIEDRKSNPFKITIIFYALKSGSTKIIFKYAIGKGNNVEKIYKINIADEENELLTQNIEDNLLDSNNLDEENIKKQILLIKELLSRELYEEALKEITTIKKYFTNQTIPTELLLLEGKALINIKIPDYDKLLNLFLKYIQDNESKDLCTFEIAEINLRIAELYFKLKNYKKSQYYYVKVISYYSDFTEPLIKAHIGLADVYIEINQIESAIKELETTLEYMIYINIIDKALIRLARIYFENSEFKDYDLAYKYYSMLKLLYPESPHIEEINERIKYLEENFIKYGD